MTKREHKYIKSKRTLRELVPIGRGIWCHRSVLDLMNKEIKNFTEDFNRSLWWSKSIENEDKIYS